MVSLGNAITNSFVYVYANQLFSRIFNDFGSNFEIIDTTGEEPLHGMIANVSKVKRGNINCKREKVINVILVIRKQKVLLLV